MAGAHDDLANIGRGGLSMLFNFDIDSDGKLLTEQRESLIALLGVDEDEDESFEEERGEGEIDNLGMLGSNSGSGSLKEGLAGGGDQEQEREHQGNEPETFVESDPKIVMREEPPDSPSMTKHCHAAAEEEEEVSERTGQKKCLSSDQGDEEQREEEHQESQQRERGEGKGLETCGYLADLDNGKKEEQRDKGAEAVSGIEDDVFSKTATAMFDTGKIASIRLQVREAEQEWSKPGTMRHRIYLYGLKIHFSEMLGSMADEAVEGTEERRRMEREQAARLKRREILLEKLANPEPSGTGARALERRRKEEARRHATVPPSPAPTPKRKQTRESPSPLGVIACLSSTAPAAAGRRPRDSPEAEGRPPLPPSSLLRSQMQALAASGLVQPMSEQAYFRLAHAPELAAERTASRPPSHPRSKSAEPTPSGETSLPALRHAATNNGRAREGSTAKGKKHGAPRPKSGVERVPLAPLQQGFAGGTSGGLRHTFAAYLASPAPAGRRRKRNLSASPFGSSKGFAGDIRASSAERSSSMRGYSDGDFDLADDDEEEDEEEGVRGGRGGREVPMGDPAAFDASRSNSHPHLTATHGEGGLNNAKIPPVKEGEGKAGGSGRPNGLELPKIRKGLLGGGKIRPDFASKLGATNRAVTPSVMKAFW